MSEIVSIREAANVLGVTPKTLRIWANEGKIETKKTIGGHRRFVINDILKEDNIKISNLKTIGYARVSTSEQKEDLQRQKKILEMYCAKNGWSFEIIEDLGSGINYNKKGLNRLMKLIFTGEVDRLIITHKDRLLRLGGDLIFNMCEHFNTEVIIINQSKDISFEEELTKDVLEIITVFSAKLYGRRSHANKKLLEDLENNISEII